MLPGVIVNGDVTPQNLVKLSKLDACAVKVLGNRCAAFLRHKIETSLLLVLCQMLRVKPAVAIS